MNRLQGLKLKFDVTDNPELSGAIQRRVFELGSEWNGGGGVDNNKSIDLLYLGEYEKWKLTWRRNSQRKPSGKYKLATLDDLYHLPNPKAKIIAPDGTEIELSDETWESMAAAWHERKSSA